MYDDDDFLKCFNALLFCVIGETFACGFLVGTALGLILAGLV